MTERLECIKHNFILTIEIALKVQLFIKVLKSRLRFPTNLNKPQYIMDSLPSAVYWISTIHSSTFLHSWYLILLTPNIRHVSKCSSPNWPLITFAEYTDVWGVCWTYLSWGCHVCSVLSLWYGLNHISASYCLYMFSVSLYFWHHRNPAKNLLF